MSHVAYEKDLEELKSDSLSKRLHALNVLLEYSKIEEDTNVLSPIIASGITLLIDRILDGNNNESTLATEILFHLSTKDVNNEFMARDKALLEALSKCLKDVHYESIKEKLKVPEDEPPSTVSSTGLLGALSLLSRYRNASFDTYVQKDEIENTLKECRVHTLMIFEEMTNNIFNSTYLYENTNVFSITSKILFTAPRGLERSLATKIFMHFTEDAIIRDDILHLIEHEIKEDFEQYRDRVIQFPSNKNELSNMNEARRNLNLLRDYIRPGIEFYNSEDFPFCKILEEKFPVIQKEFQALELDNYVRWPEKYLCKKGWDVFPFYAFKNKLEDNCKLCPETTKILESIPGLTTAMFSKLEPRTHIRPHIGYYQYSNKILRAHLGIKVPPLTALVVNGKEMHWKEGSTFVFDDTFRHEAYNKSQEDRVVLLVDFLHNCNDLQRNPDFMAVSPNVEDEEDALISPDLIEALGEFLEPQNCKSSVTSLK